MKPSGIITFLSDFGSSDWFVAAVKGAILAINRRATIIDVTHTIQPHDIQSAAFVLSRYHKDFPVGTIHLVVVDPGVGSSRRAIAAVSKGHTFVAPDNGLLSYVLRDDATLYSIPIPEEASSTFHARDVFGPAAAHLSLGNKAFFTKIPDREYKRLQISQCKMQRDTVIGNIVYIDRFGNCITNIPVKADIVNLCINKVNIPVREYYGQGEKGEIIGIKGSSGLYEIVVNQGKAQPLLNARVGTKVVATIRNTD